jgi:hypothetical protein
VPGVLELRFLCPFDSREHVVAQGSRVWGLEFLLLEGRDAPRTDDADAPPFVAE